MGSGINPKMLEQLNSSTPLGRLGNAKEFALVV
jgi:hypothetical protein